MLKKMTSNANPDEMMSDSGDRHYSSFSSWMHAFTSVAQLRRLADSIDSLNQYGCFDAWHRFGDKLAPVSTA